MVASLLLLLLLLLLLQTGRWRLAGSALAAGRWGRGLGGGTATCPALPAAAGMLSASFALPVPGLVLFADGTAACMCDAVRCLIPSAEDKVVGAGGLKLLASSAGEALFLLSIPVEDGQPAPTDYSLSVMALRLSIAAGLRSVGRGCLG